MRPPGSPRRALTTRCGRHGPKVGPLLGVFRRRAHAVVAFVAVAVVAAAVVVVVVFAVGEKKKEEEIWGQILFLTNIAGR